MPEPVRATFRKRDPIEADQPDARFPALALAPRRDVREAYWRDGLSLARDRSGYDRTAANVSFNTSTKL